MHDGTRRSIGRDTTLCISLAARPGTFGSRFHNHLYGALGLDWIYKAFTTRDLPAAIGGVRALGIRGCAVSMPFKEACIPLLDGLAPSASAIGAVNTIVNDSGTLTGHNTDHRALLELLSRRALRADTTFALRGSGGLAKAVLVALADAGLRDGVVVARNEGAGRPLAERHGARWQRDVSVRASLLVNATPLGMTGPDAGALAFPDDAIASADLVLDVVAQPRETPLAARARALGKPVITGDEVIVLQAVHQFALYTGIAPPADAVAAAAAFALG
jgi:shikimate dehydrogenase